MTPQERTRVVLHGGVPDRPPVFDLLCNDAVLAHFAGERADGLERAAIVYRALAAGAVDATRAVGIPQDEGEAVWPTGQKVSRKRWTTWVDPLPFVSVEDAAAQMRAAVDAPSLTDEQVAAGARGFEADYQALAARDCPLRADWELLPEGRPDGPLWRVRLG